MNPIQWGMRKFSLISVVISLFVCASPVRASDLLEQVDAFLGYPSFADSFHTGDTLSFRQGECIEQGPCSEMRGFTRAEMDSSGQSVKLQYLKPDGSLYSLNTITAQRWQEMQGNLVRFEMAILASYSLQVTVDQIAESQIEVLKNGVPEKLSTLRVQLTAANQLGMVVKEVLEVARDMRGLSQLVRREKHTNRPIPNRQIYTVTAWNDGV